MDGICRLASDKEMDMIGHDFHVFQGDSQFVCFLLQQNFQSFIHSVYQYFSPILRTKYNVITQIENTMGI